MQTVGTRTVRTVGARMAAAAMGLWVAALAFGPALAWAADDLKKVKGYADVVQKGQAGMTLWQIIQAGGWVMVVLGVISVLMVALVIYLFLTMRPQKLVPQDLAHDLIRHLRDEKIETVRRLCLENKSPLAVAILAGVDKVDRGVRQANEAIEIISKREVSKLWQKIGWLSDIVTIAPLLGLLGTVLGMIQAFNSIAFNSAAVKPILLAGGVAKAMITTAAGLIIAIIAMGFYSFFRARVQETTNLLEIFVNDALNALSGEKQDNVPSRSVR